MLLFPHALHSLLTFSSSKENVFLTRLEAGFPVKNIFLLEKKRRAQRTFSSPKENVLAGPGAHRGENIPNLWKFDSSLSASLDFSGSHIC